MRTSFNVFNGLVGVCRALYGKYQDLIWGLGLQGLRSKGLGSRFSGLGFRGLGV